MAELANIGMSARWRLGCAAPDRPVLRALGDARPGPVLTALPVGPARPCRTADPTFDIARPAIFMLPHQDAAWRIIKERIDALQQACASVGQQPGPRRARPARRQAAVDEPGHQHTRRQHTRLTATMFTMRLAEAPPGRTLAGRSLSSRSITNPPIVS
jgi:hypothetical protein